MKSLHILASSTLIEAYRRRERGFDDIRSLTRQELGAGNRKETCFEGLRIECRMGSVLQGTEFQTIEIDLYWSGYEILKRVLSPRFRYHEAIATTDLFHVF